MTDSTGTFVALRGGIRRILWRLWHTSGGAPCLHISIAVMVGCTPLHGQVPTSLAVPCNAEWCKEEQAFGVTLDTLTQQIAECRDVTPEVFRWVVASPFTMADTTLDTLDARSRRLLQLPIGSKLYRVDSRGGNPFSGTGSVRIPLRDTRDILEGHVAQNACLFVFAPLSWRGERMAVVRVGVVNSNRSYLAEHYLSLRREGMHWRVDRTELGVQR